MKTPPLPKLSPMLIMLALLTSAGCPAPIPHTVLGPLSTNGDLVYVSADLNFAVALDPSGHKQPLEMEIQPLARAFVPTPTGFLLTGGDGNDPHLDVVTIPQGTVQAVSVAGAYDFAWVTPDGSFAILSFNPNATPAINSPAARNNNEITVVNLKSLTPTKLSLNTASLAPEHVAFSADNQVAAILLDGTVVLMMLDNPAVQVQVPLSLPDGTTLHPQKALFSPDGAFVYVLATGTDDVVVLNVNRGNGTLTTAVNFLLPPNASGLSDITVPSGTGFTGYVAAVYTGTPSAALLDATGDTSLTHILPSTTGGTTFFDFGNNIVMITTPGSSSFTVWEPLLDRYDSGQLPGTTAGAPIIADGNALFIEPATAEVATGSATLTNVTITDNGAQLVARQNPLVLAGTPTSTAYDPVSDLLFLGIPVASASNSSTTVSAVVSIKPSTLGIGGFNLTESTSGMGIVGGFTYANVQSNYGDVWFFPVTSTSSGDAKEQTSFL